MLVYVIEHKIKSVSKYRSPGDWKPFDVRFTRDAARSVVRRLKTHEINPYAKNIRYRYRRYVRDEHWAP